MRYVVCGPPGAGKTTWVEQRRRPGDVVFDLDVVADVVFQMPRFPRPSPVVRCLELMRQAVLVWITRSGYTRAVQSFIIIADPSEAAAIARTLGAELVRLPDRPLAVQGGGGLPGGP